MASCYNAYVFTLLIPPAVLSLINADLGPSPNYTWITISWNLGGAIFVTVGGRLSDLFGRRWFFIAGSATLVVGSIVGATGQSIPQMIACGAIYGAGSGFLEMAYGAVQVSILYLPLFVGEPRYKAASLLVLGLTLLTLKTGDRPQQVSHGNNRRLRHSRRHRPILSSLCLGPDQLDR